QDVYVIKLDSIANIQWTKTIGGNVGDYGYSIIQTNDGGYAVAGYTGSFNVSYTDFYLIKLDSIGNLLWTKTVGGNNYDFGNCIIQTIDSGYAVVGWTNSFGSSASDRVYVIKLEYSGNLEWAKTIEYGNCSGNSIIQAKDGGYIIGGGNGSIFLIKL